jgi:hypothetical protein
VARATEVSNRYATRLLANPRVAGIAVGHSQDEPGRAAVIIYVNSMPQPRSFPPELGGVRTRIIPIPTMQSPADATATPSEAEMARVGALKEQWAQQLLRSNPAIFAVGVGTSEDSPGEAAIVLFVDKNASYSPPVALAGARTKVVRSDRFRAWGWNEHPHPRACPAPTRKQSRKGIVLPKPA